VFHRGRGQLMSTPETDEGGRFRWRLPAGDYGVAVIFGGLAPTGQPHRLPGGGLVFVNGIVDPGLAFTLPADATVDLGTLFVEVETKAYKPPLFAEGRVFGRLAGLRVEPGPTSGATGARGDVLQAPMRVIDPREAREMRGRAAPPPAGGGGLPPVNPQVLLPLIR